MTQTLPEASDPAHQDFEVQWWGDCANTFSEETKQLTYAHRMGLLQTTLGEKWPMYDLGRRSVIDVGGGPCSLLLKCLNAGQATVVDPGVYPHWTRERYEHCQIQLIQQYAEDALARMADTWEVDEVWMYNVLQHVIDPYAIIHASRKIAERIRIFEWVNTPPSMGHPHTLTEEALDEALDGKGTVAMVDENNCVGLAYYGSFKVK